MAMKCLNCNHERLRYQAHIDSYVCLNCGYKFAKQYFFISHSHLDIEKVRIIRNVIEETFFYEPILFFLKCLSDENELQDLIRREISERIWFVYCKSKNAEQSKYVQQERKYLQNLIDSGKHINVLNIELDDFEIWDKECYEHLRSQIAFQIKTSKIFISYAHDSARFARELYEQFTFRHYSVWIDTDMSAGAAFFESVSDRIKKNSYKDGVFLLLISPKTLQSSFVQAELQTALRYGAYVVPVLLQEDGISEAALVQEIQTNAPHIAHLPYLIINPSNSSTACDKIIQSFRNPK